MKVEVTARGNGLTEKVRSYAEQKIGKLERYFDRIISARVVLAADAGSHKAEVVVSPGTGPTLIGECEEAQTFYAAIDAAADKLERQVKKLKEKLVDRNRKPAR